MEKKSSWNGLVVLLVLIGAVGVKAHSPLEIEKLLKKLNKPAIKTIKSPDGDIIDCVDIYKQPAFDHPLLKNHTIEMRSNFSPEKVERGNYSEEYPEQIWRRHGSCPEGTIPIRRVLKSDFVRSESLEMFGAVYPNPIGSGSGRLETAGGTMAIHPPKYFNGAGATISIWAPTVERTEFSAALVHVGNDQNYINGGWMANENKFSNSEPRLLVSYGTNGRDCMNLLCPGFVQLNHQIALGVQLAPSRIGEDPSTLQVKIRKDATLWEVWIHGVQLGYYPLSVFSGFNRANNLQWHGRVLNKRLFGQHTITQMGSGMFSSWGYKRSGHFQNIHYIDEDNVTRYRLNRLQIVADYPRCYDAMKSGSRRGVRGPSVFFGGPGRPHCDQP